MVCLFQAPTVVRLVVESPLVGHMQGYHCIRHHVEGTVPWRPLVQELLLETEPSSGMWESLLICCFLSDTFSQEPIGRILGVEIWEEVSNKKDKKWNTLRQWILFPWPAAVLAFGKTLPSSHYWFYFDYECLQLFFPYLPYLATVGFGEKKATWSVSEFSVAGNLPLR